MEIMSIKGEGVGRRLMENFNLDFHSVFWNTSFTLVLTSIQIQSVKFK